MRADGLTSHPTARATPSLATPSIAALWQELSAGTRRSALARARERIPVPAYDARAAWAAVDGPSTAAVVDAARAVLGSDWPRPLLRDYAAYWRSGVRTAWEDPAREIRTRTSTAVLAACLTGEEALLDEAADGLLVLCEQSTWCWAAHERFATAEQTVVPDPLRPFLDLGAAETVLVLAWADLALDAALERRVPGLRRRIRLEAVKRVVEPFLADRTWHWLGDTGTLNNWSAWIHSGVLAAALLLDDDAARREATVDLVVAGLDRYAGSLPADGGCDEGFAYWWQGAERLYGALEVLHWASSGAFDPLRSTPLDEVGRYPHRMALGGGWFVNVADGSARPPRDQPWDTLHRWGRRMGDDDVVAFAAGAVAPGAPRVAVAAGLHRSLVGLHDLAWRAAGPGGTPFPDLVVLPDTELVVARQHHGSARGMAFAVKGGHNDESHNHNDVGSVVVALDGCPVLLDLGQPTYTALTFSPRRYEHWVVQSQWHTLPAPDGVEQAVGREFRAGSFEVDATDTTEAAVRVVVDLTPAYPPQARLDRLLREVRLDRGTGDGAVTGAGTVTVTDRWRRRQGESVTLHHMVAGEPSEHAPGRLRVRTLDGATALLAWDPALGAGVLERREVDDPTLERVWGPAVHRLSVVVPDAVGEFSLVVSEVSETSGTTRPSPSVDPEPEADRA